MNDLPMRRLILTVIAALMLTGLFAAAPAAVARRASVCQPNGTGCAKAGTYSGLNDSGSVVLKTAATITGNAPDNCAPPGSVPGCAD